MVKVELEDMLEVMMMRTGANELLKMRTGANKLLKMRTGAKSSFRIYVLLEGCALYLSHDILPLSLLSIKVQSIR